MNQLPRKGQGNSVETRRSTPVPDSFAGAGWPATTGQRVFMFQNLVTIKGTDDPASVALQPFGGWFDGKDVDMVQFKVEILWCSRANLVLESSPHPEEATDQWSLVEDWTASTGGTFEIVTAVSDSGALAAGKQFSRYIRWRACGQEGYAWAICFRIKAVVGSTFTQFAEIPRVV